MHAGSFFPPAPENQVLVLLRPMFLSGLMAAALVDIIVFGHERMDNRSTRHETLPWMLLMCMKQKHISSKMLTRAHNGEKIIIGKAGKPYAKRIGCNYDHCCPK